MKKLLQFSLILFFTFILNSCSDDDDGKTPSRMLPVIIESTEGNDKPSRTELQYDDQDRIIKVIKDYKGEDTKTFTVSYSSGGWLNRITYNDRFEQFAYSISETDNLILRYTSPLSQAASVNEEESVPDTLWLDNKNQLVKIAFASQGTPPYDWSFVKIYTYDNRGNILKVEEKRNADALPSYTSEYKYDSKNGALRMVKSPQWFSTLYIEAGMQYNNVSESRNTEYYGNGEVMWSSKGIGNITYNSEGFPTSLLFTFDKGSGIQTTIEYIKR